MVKLGVIGCGYWGSKLIRTFGQLSDVNLCAISDINEENTYSLLRQYPQLMIFKNYKEMLNRSLDAIVIATDSITHFQIAKEALKAGKDVFVEKPMSLNSKHCKELIEISERKHRILMVGHTFIYNAAVNKLKECIDSGQLGDIYYLYSARLNLGRVRRDVNDQQIRKVEEKLRNVKREVEKLADIVFSHSIVRARTEDIGILSLQDAKNGGAVGPTARASGWKIDVRTEEGKKVKIEYVRNARIVLLPVPKLAVEEGIFWVLQKTGWLYPYVAEWRFTLHGNDRRIN